MHDPDGGAVRSDEYGVWNPWPTVPSSVRASCTEAAVAGTPPAAIDLNVVEHSES